MKNWKISSKSVTVLLKKKLKLKNVFKKHYGSSEKSEKLKKSYGPSFQKKKN